jgi:ribosomal protein S18 acetylase RimI-like enzyme
MRSRSATRSDAEAVTDIHMRCLPPAVSDFSFLGRRIVERFYINAMARGLGAVAVACDEDEVAGFVLVTRDVNALFTKALLSSPGDVLAFMLQASPIGLLRAVWIKVSSRMTQIPAVPKLVYIAVYDRFRGRGCGAILMDAAEAWFREEGLAYYELDVHAENPSALGLYLSKGMRIKQSYVKNRAQMHTLSKAL